MGAQASECVKNNTGHNHRCQDAQDAQQTSQDAKEAQDACQTCQDAQEASGIIQNALEDKCKTGAHPEVVRMHLVQ